MSEQKNTAKLAYDGIKTILLMAERKSVEIAQMAGLAEIEAMAILYSLHSSAIAAMRSMKAWDDPKLQEIIRMIDGDMDVEIILARARDQAAEGGHGKGV